MIDIPVEVKDALREGRLKKNYRMVVLNDDGTEDFTIDNDTLVSESVSIDERMCSGDTIKFGLCEGSSLEFQYFNHENITDRQVQVFCDVEYGANTPYTIPMGFFTVKKCSRQASTGIIKVTAYNKLQSDYLDAKANETLLGEMVDKNTLLTMYSIRETLLADYQIKEYDEVESVPRVGYSPFSSIQLNERFTSTETDNNPISLRNLQYQYHQTAPWAVDKAIIKEVVIMAKSFEYSVPLGFSQLKYLKYSMSELLSCFITYVKKLFDDAELSITGQEFVDSIVLAKNTDAMQVTHDTGWGYVLSTALQHQNMTPYDAYYSDYAYIKGQTATYCPIVGATSDFHKMVLEQPIAHLRVYIPTGLRVVVGRTDNTVVEYANISLHNDTEYYKKDGSIDIYPSLKLLDGTPYSIDSFIDNLNYVKLLNLTEADLITVNPSQMTDFTLRDITSASYETVCQFGKLDRVTDLFSGVELNHSRLLPQDTLYPSDSLYPYGSGESAFRSQYSKLWADEGNIHKWRYLIITYKGLDGEGNETDYTLQRTVNNDGTDDYNCSDNWLFRNLVWTAEQIGTYADAMKAKMQDITWFPFEMWCAGLPYLETGDEIEIPLGNQTYTSYILQRQLKGIQNLQDTYINGTLDIF